MKNFDYSRNGLYFITICTKDRTPYLSEIRGVGDGVLDVPKIKIKKYGEYVKEQINEINSVYEKIKIIKYVIMPDHVHMIIYIFDDNKMFGVNGDDEKLVEGKGFLLKIGTKKIPVSVMKIKYKID
ncbi:MAG: hypothetical protein J6A30_01665, partial [Ruminococcus sp.]|nr:hypothetical protein [Ruminococcus sp.]